MFCSNTFFLGVRPVLDPAPTPGPASQPTWSIRRTCSGTTKKFRIFQRTCPSFSLETHFAMHALICSMPCGFVSSLLCPKPACVHPPSLSIMQPQCFDRWFSCDHFFFLDSGTYPVTMSNSKFFCLSGWQGRVPNNPLDRFLPTANT